ncbi:sugar phosphate nucleotidyltransferase [Pleomorphomonas oryzae]|uniref:sugar phosphate nucleotidyltransferase n=1 Tax=Pleomorphomonas oryzae TaxID=261934 RepID=UPI0004098F03|nr:sugar phosphate nucleotidyltransferase [Pleomorphomonas oryzae]
MPFPFSPKAPVVDAFCVLLAGGQGTRLHELTSTECKPAVAFAGGKLVDFTVANVMRSGMAQLLVATQYLPDSLVRHLAGEWRHQFPGGLEIRDGCHLRPGGYRGTADAVRANLAEIAASGADELLVLSADHVYQMDYRAMIEAHRAAGAKVTVAVDEVPLAQASSFGVLSADGKGWVTGFAEKPARPQPVPEDPTRALVSMGVYVLDRRWLAQLLTSEGAMDDFGQDILPEAVRQGSAQVYCPSSNIEGAFYWRDVGTLDSYRLAQLDFLDPAKAPIALPTATVKPSRQMLQAAEYGTILLPGARLGYRARAKRAILAPGSYVPDGLAIGEDPEEDRRWFRVTCNGTSLVTPAMLERHREERPRFHLVAALPFLSP